MSRAGPSVAERAGLALLRAALGEDRLTRGEVERRRVIETARSWILVAGSTAYRVPRPDGLDSPAARLEACRRELSLGRHLAPAFYRRVLEVRGADAVPHLGGRGPLLEAAVETRAFPPSERFDRIAVRGALTAADVDRLAMSAARFHRVTARGPTTGRGATGRLRALREPLPADATVDPAATAWFTRELARREDELAARHAAGWGRAVHGDLTLAHAARCDGAVAFFAPAIERGGAPFDDVVTDAAALAADVHAAGYPALAWRLINRWMMELGDLSAPAVVPLALVAREIALARAGRVVDRELIRTLVAPPHPLVVMMHGLTGSGKSTLAAELAARLGGFLVRSDAVRKALLGLSPHAHTASAPDAGAYAAGRTQATYGAVCETVARGLAAGRSVVADACFLTADQRARLAEAAARHGAGLAIVAVQADLDVLEARVRARALRGDDVSEADLTVLDRQRARLEPLTAAERSRALTVTTHGPVEVGELVGAVRRLAHS